MEDMLMKLLYVSLDLSLLTLFPPDNLHPLGNPSDGSLRGPQFRLENSAFSEESTVVSPYFGRSGPGVTTGVDFITNLINVQIDGVVNVTNGLWQIMHHRNNQRWSQEQEYKMCMKTNGYNHTQCDYDGLKQESNNIVSTNGDYVRIAKKSAVQVDKWLTNPEVSETMDMFYGMFRGQPECIKKTVCLFGNNLNSMPAGRFVLQTWLHMLPLDWKEIKRILRKSFLEQENCKSYRCGFSFRRTSSASSSNDIPIKRTLALESSETPETDITFRE